MPSGDPGQASSEPLPDTGAPIVRGLPDTGAPIVRTGVSIGERLVMEERETLRWYLVVRVETC